MVDRSSRTHGSEAPLFRCHTIKGVCAGKTRRTWILIGAGAVVAIIVLIAVMTDRRVEHAPRGQSVRSPASSAPRAGLDTRDGHRDSPQAFERAQTNGPLIPGVARATPSSTVQPHSPSPSEAPVQPAQSAPAQQQPGGTPSSPRTPPAAGVGRTMPRSPPGWNERIHAAPAATPSQPANRSQRETQALQLLGKCKTLQMSQEIPDVTSARRSIAITSDILAEGSSVTNLREAALRVQDALNLGQHSPQYYVAVGVTGRPHIRAIRQLLGAEDSHQGTEYRFRWLVFCVENDIVVAVKADCNRVIRT